MKPKGKTRKRTTELAAADKRCQQALSERKQPEEDLPKLFRIDVQYTNVGTAGEKGTGMGLTLCKDLVARNGGTIWVESEVGKGTTFLFTVPARKELDRKI